MGFLQDVKFGFRMLVKNPGFTLVAVITIALGIGVNSTVFTLTNAVLFKGLPFEKPDEILHINSADPAHQRSRMPVSYRDFADFRERANSFQGLAAVSQTSVDLSDEYGQAERVSGARVSASTFSLLGQQPFRGRDFTAGEDTASASPVVLLGYGLWQNRYGGNENVIGKSIKANQKFYTVIGIMPPGMKFPNNQEMWFPIVPGSSDEKRDARQYNLLGRLKPGVSAEQARTEMKSIAQQLAQTYPDTNKDIETVLQTSSEFYNGGEIRTLFLAMQCAVAFVLLIACANVANLLLSRALRRSRETSIRTALGANRWRIVRQLLIESIMLSFLGGLIGLLFSIYGVRIFDAAVENTGKPYWIDFTMDYHVALFFVAVCTLTGILFGLAPALQISKSNVGESLKDGGRGASGGKRTRRLTGALLIGEICLTLVLLAGAGLMIRSFLKSQMIDLGFQPGNVLVARVAARGPKYLEPASLITFEERLFARLAEIQGLEALTLASNPPAGGSMARTLKLEDRDIADGNGKLPSVGVLVVAPGYFEALGLKTSRGREFTMADGGAGAEAAIVDESFAKKYWPGEDPVGKRVRLGDKADAPWINVVGLSPRILQSGGGPRQDMYPPLVYLPYRQEPAAGFAILTRSRLPRETLTANLRNALRELDPDIPLFNIATMDETLAQQNWPYRVFGSLFATFAAIALVMSSVGIYAVTAYGINQRTQEIGVRMALGASQKNVMWLVLKQGLVRIGAGLSLGLLAAWGLSRVLSSLLFQVSATDPVTFVTISLILALVTGAACVVPARRAMRMDPVNALRAE